MKIKLTKNQMRYIDKGEWWRIKFPNKKKNIEGGLEHRCAVEQTGWWREEATLEWVPCVAGPHAVNVPECANCKKQPPEELQADAIMLGIKARKTDWMDEFRKMTRDNTKPFEPTQPVSPWQVPMPASPTPYIRKGIGNGTAPDSITWEKWTTDKIYVNGDAPENDITIIPTSKTYVDNVTYYYENALDIVKGKIK